MKNKQRDKEGDRSNVPFTIVDFYKRGLGTKDILSRLKISEKTIKRYRKILKASGIIIKKGYGTWQLSKEYEALTNKELSKVIDDIIFSKRYIGEGDIKSSVGLTNENYQSNLHALRINMPIGSGKLDLVKDFEGYAQTTFKNWIPQYKKILSPIGMTLTNNNNKSVDINIFSREMPKTLDFMPLIFKSAIYVYELLRKQDVILDIFSIRVTTLHIQVRNDDLDRVFNNHERFEVLLGRPTTKIFENDLTQEAKAYVDSSPYLGIETNDIKYKENLVMMPERVDRIQELMVSMIKLQQSSVETQDKYATAIQEHLKLVVSLQQVSTAMNNTIKHIQKRERKLGSDEQRYLERKSQKSLSDF